MQIIPTFMLTARTATRDCRNVNRVRDIARARGALIGSGAVTMPQVQPANLAEKSTGRVKWHGILFPRYSAVLRAMNSRARHIGAQVCADADGLLPPWTAPRVQPTKVAGGGLLPAFIPTKEFIRNASMQPIRRLAPYLFT